MVAQYRKEKAKRIIWNGAEAVSKMEKQYLEYKARQFSKF